MVLFGGVEYEQGILHFEPLRASAGHLSTFVLSNKPLDAAKRNRCLQVFRDRADQEDLEPLNMTFLVLDLGLYPPNGNHRCSKFPLVD